MKKIGLMMGTILCLMMTGCGENTGDSGNVDAPEKAYAEIEIENYGTIKSVICKS